MGTPVGMPRRAPVPIATAVVAAAFLLAGCGGDDGGGAGRVERGDPAVGFPLRGSLAKDDKAIDGAVAAFRKATAKARKNENVDHTWLGPDANDRVTVLWAGRVDDRDQVIAEGGDEVAQITRLGQLGWHVDGTSLRDPSRTRGMPLGAGSSVVVPDDGQRWTYVDASGHATADGLLTDGLFVNASSDPEGFVLPADDDAAPNGPMAYLPGIGGRTFSRRSFADLRAALDDGGARALYLAAAEGQRAVADAAKASPQSQDLRRLQPLQVVWTGRLPDRPHAAVVAQGRDSAESVALGYGKQGGRNQVNHDPKEGAQLLGFGAGGLAGSNTEGAVVAGAYVELDKLPYLVLAGLGAKTLHALVGGREVTRPGPAAVVAAEPLLPADTRTAPDTVVFGRDEHGQVIAPLATG